jgi:hypothetical protein
MQHQKQRQTSVAAGQEQEQKMKGLCKGRANKPAYNNLRSLADKSLLERPPVS